MQSNRTKLRVIVLGLGVIAGYGSGIASIVCHRAQRRDAIERHVARVCLDAARGPTTPSRQGTFAPW